MVTGTAQIIEVVPGQLGATIGLVSGDAILSINGRPVNNQNISQVLKDQIGQTVPLTYRRADAEQTISLPCPTQTCVLGIFMENNSTEQILPIKYPPHIAMGKAAHEIVAQAKLTFPALGGIITNAVSSKKADRQQALQNLS